DDFHALDEPRRNLVEIRRRGLDDRIGRAGPEPTAVHEHEGPVRSETAKVSGRYTTCSGQTAGLVAEVLAEIVDERLGQRQEDVHDVVLARDRDLLRGDDLNRARAAEV